MDFEQFVVPHDYFQSISDRIRYNETVASLYEQLGDSENDGQLFQDYSFERHAGAIRSCGNYWQSQYFRLQQVKDIQRVNLCHDKFCYNCQSLLASQRLMKYTPILDSLWGQYTLCHVVFTYVNPKPSGLFLVVNRMFDHFKHLTRIFSGNIPVAGMDFYKYGYAGVVRCFEVTFNEEKRTFHPHFHCIFLFRKGITFPGHNLRKFSFDKYGKKAAHYFSDFEILLQNIWYLLMNDIKVTKKAIEELKEGYSVWMEPLEKGRYQEIFKYACKGTFEVGVGMILSLDEFRYLHKSLFRKHVIQGYGILRNFKDDDAAIVDYESFNLYLKVIKRLSSVEESIGVSEYLQEVLAEKNCRYISKSNFRRMYYYIRSMEQNPNE